VNSLAAFSNRASASGEPMSSKGDFLTRDFIV
jgi:hypothetical protein